MAKPQIVISNSQIIRVLMIHVLIIDRLSSYWVHSFHHRISSIKTFRSTSSVGICEKVVDRWWHHAQLIMEGMSNEFVLPSPFHDLVLGSSRNHPPSTPYNRQSQGYQRWIRNRLGQTVWPDSAEQARSGFRLNTYPISTPLTFARKKSIFDHF